MKKKLVIALLLILTGTAYADGKLTCQRSAQGEGPEVCTASWGVPTCSYMKYPDRVVVTGVSGFPLTISKIKSYETSSSRNLAVTGINAASQGVKNQLTQTKDLMVSFMQFLADACFVMNQEPAICMNLFVTNLDKKTEELFFESYYWYTKGVAPGILKKVKVTEDKIRKFDKFGILKMSLLSQSGLFDDVKKGYLRGYLYYLYNMTVFDKNEVINTLLNYLNTAKYLAGEEHDIKFVVDDMKKLDKTEIEPIYQRYLPLIPDEIKKLNLSKAEIWIPILTIISLDGGIK